MLQPTRRPFQIRRDGHFFFANSWLDLKDSPAPFVSLFVLPVPGKAGESDKFEIYPNT
jgi:hypothetical protein